MSDVSVPNRTTDILKRFFVLLRCDILFQFRYGFYWLYAFFVILYAALLSVFPPSVQPKAVALLVYTDPAAMGLFFMGAIVLFEKSQHVIESFSISPIRIYEYIFSKALSISLVSLLSSWIISFSVYLSRNIFFQGLIHFVLFSGALVLSSFLFTLGALICASKSKTLNRFMVLTIPFELVFMVPPILLVFGLSIPVLEYHPGIIALRMILNDNVFHPCIAILILVIWNAIFAFFAIRSVRSMMFNWEGITL